MALYLGLDVGGTKTAVGVVTGDGGVLSQLRLPTLDLRQDGDPLRRLIAMGRAAVAASGAAEPVRALGITLPGPFDTGTLSMLAAPTIPELEGVPLERPLAEAFGCPVAADNDANACALAESRFGAGRDHPSTAYFTISTGIGGGFVDYGRLYRGHRGTSTEFGHQVILPLGGPPCDCGGTGCLEALASGRGITRRFHERLPATDERRRALFTTEAVALWARHGDPLAREIWSETALYVGLGLSNVINVLDPAVVVIGGGVGIGAGDLLLDPIREVVRTRCMPTLRREVPILPAALGLDLAVISAATLAMP